MYRQAYRVATDKHYFFLGTGCRFSRRSAGPGAYVFEIETGVENWDGFATRSPQVIVMLHSSHSRTKGHSNWGRHVAGWLYREDVERLICGLQEALKVLDDVEGVVK